MTQIGDERRVFKRTAFNLEMALKFEEEFFQCELLNISESGALAQVNGGDPSQLKIGNEGLCYLDYLDESFEGKCRVVRIENKLLAVEFWGLDVDQIFYVRSVIEELA